MLSKLDPSIYYKIDAKLRPSFDLVTLIQSLNFSHNFVSSGRKAVYFGHNPYSYAGGIHYPSRTANITANQHVKEMLYFPTYELKFVFN